MKNKQRTEKFLKFAKQSGIKISSREGVSLEFKESFNWGSKDEYAKSAAAFANAQGGTFIFGVKDKPRELVGLQTKNFEDFDEAKIAEYFNSIFSPEVSFEKSVQVVRGKQIGVLRIYPSLRKPVVAIKNDKAIKEGEIYYRYNARSDKVKYPEMQALLDDVKSQEREYWKSIFERIAQIGSKNLAIMNVAEGTIEGNGGNLILDERLIPRIKFIREGSFKEGGQPTLKLVGQVVPVSVISTKKRGSNSKNFRITDDPNAPVVRLEEEDVLKEFPLDFVSLTETLRKRYKDFKSDPKYHQVRRELMSKGFSKTRRLNPNKINSSKQDFYSLNIINEFDKYYKK